MARKLPETIVLGKLRLTRKRDTYGKLTSTWGDDNNYNELVRSSKGMWAFEGSPLDHYWGKDGWYGTPQAAYRAALEHQLTMLGKQYARDVKAIKEALRDAQ